MSSLQNFYIFTGKGGVGKTTLSLAFSKYLQDSGNDVSLAYFKNSKIAKSSIELTESEKLAKDIGVDFLELDLLDSAKEYMGRKLKSKKIASWIVKTPFFKSLLNMIPGFNYVIYLGQILEWIEENPNKIIVLDAPASGHAQTMLEAPSNFKSIFKSGELFEDTKKMQKMLENPELTKMHIITLPTQLAVTESLELKNSLLNIAPYRVQISCNHSFSELDLMNPPNFLKEKIAIEDKAMDMLTDQDNLILPYIAHQGVVELVKGLVPSMKNLV